PTPPAAADADAPSRLPRCICARADSPLWKDGLPELAVLPFARAEDGAAPVTPRREPNGRGRYAFEIAAVNDAAVPVRDVRITITFARRNKKGKRVGATDRGLFWEGALLPGHAVKWRVKAPGTEMRIDASVTGTLEAGGLEPAAADAAIELTRSQYRAVRLQGAKLLAYERDPRAVEVVSELSAGATPSEAPVLAELARASAPLIACGGALDADASDAAGASFASACVFNAGTTPASVALHDRDRGTDVPVPGAVPPHEGVRVTWPAPAPPGALEVRARPATQRSGL
ncbi:MAG TPA: hypothetical protein VHB21_18975, partial [Minicystis sp.]|nr:hypothetical protein [Minicystis sp.]